MEKDQEVKHICKFCYKSFPCGRALGGHMRSHLSNTAESAGKFSKKKVSTLIVYDNDNNEDPGFKDDGAQIAYSLRENRKKKSQFANSSEDSYSLENKVCKVCGKEFPSWKALFSHMKQHSDKLPNTFDEYSLNCGNQKEEMVLDSQSDNDNEFAAPIRKQRSSRTFKRYRNSDTTTSVTTLSVTNALECVSETDQQEQEEVALSLILLSMDVYNQRTDLKSIDDSSDNNNSEFQEAMSVTRSDGKNFNCSENKTLNSKTLSSIDMEFERSSNLFKDSFIIKGELEERKESHDPVSKKQKSRKRKLKALDQNQEISLDCSMKLVCDNVSDSQVIQFLGSEKKIKFECTSCKKTFHSYQALGGHRASHKKKASLGSKLDSTENSTDTDISTVTPQDLMSYNATIGSTLASRNLVSGNVATKSAVTSQNLKPSISTVKLAVTSQNLEPSISTVKLAITSQNTQSNSATLSPVTSQNIRPEMSIPRPRVFDPKFKSRKVIISDNGFKKLTNSDHGLSKKHNKLHECPLCFKVFPSGQAFGGHKRYHLLAEAKNNKQTDEKTTETSVKIINQEEQIIPEKIRDFLDLNLPAPEQEAEISGASSNPWWMASSNHKRQPLLHVGPHF